MKKHQKTLLTVAIVIIVLGTFLSIIGVVMGAGKMRGYMGRRGEEDIEFGLGDYDESGNMEEVKSIRMEFGYGEVRFVTGDELRIRGTNVADDDVDSYMEGDTWVFRYDDERDGWGGWFLWGVGFRWREQPQFEVTIPEGFAARDISLTLDAGTLYAEELSGDTIDVEVGAGTYTIREVSAVDKLSVEVGAGEMVIDNMRVGDVEMDCGAGRIDAEGSILGNAEVDCGIGEVDVNVDGDPDQFNYKVDCGLGEVRINDQSYKVSASVDRENGADHDFVVKCGVGSVDVDIEQEGSDEENWRRGSDVGSWDEE